MQRTRSNVLGKVINNVLKTQRQEFNKGNTENSGASIDVIAVVKKLVTHPRYRGNASASALVEEISQYDDVLKYAKPLTKFTQAGAYHVVMQALRK